jgi:hypothetical protein
MGRFRVNSNTRTLIIDVLSGRVNPECYAFGPAITVANRLTSTRDDCRLVIPF